MVHLPQEKNFHSPTNSLHQLHHFQSNPNCVAMVPTSLELEWTAWLVSTYKRNLLLPVFGIAVDQKRSHDQLLKHSLLCNVVEIGAIVQIVVSCCVAPSQWYPSSSNAAATALETASYCYLRLVFDEILSTGRSAADGH